MLFLRQPLSATQTDTDIHRLVYLSIIVIMSNDFVDDHEYHNNCVCVCL